MANEPTQQNESPSDQAKSEGLLYHYTDQNGLLGILSSKTIWSTHIRYLNDTSEGRIVSNVIFDEISSRYKIPRVFQELGSIDNKSDDDSEEIDFETLNQGSAMAAWATSQNVFVTSFSKHGNSLSQWRAYSGKPGGYSIGFRPEYLRAVGDHFLRGRHDIFSGSDALFPCTYYNEEAKEAFKGQIKDLVSAYIKEAASRVEVPVEGGGEGFRSLGAIALKHFIQLGNLSAIFKDAGFAEEAEWRLAFLLHQNSTPADLKFRPGSSMPVPYIEVPLALGDQIIGIDEVYVGPCPHPGEAARSVEMLLHTSGFRSVQVKESKIPFRSW